jgi:E3 ubiquitin-protein ligase SHPRH
MTGAAAAAAVEYPFQGEQQLVLAGSYGTKIEAVVRRVLFVLQQDPVGKVLVFSSWADVLDIVSHALSDNGVLHVSAKDRKGLLQALEKFKGCQVSSAELAGALPANAAAAAGKAGPAGSSRGSRASSSTRLSAQCASNSGSEQQQEFKGLDGMDVDEDSSDTAGGDAQQQQQQQQQWLSSVTAATGAPVGDSSAANAAAAAAADAAGRVASAAGPRVLLLLVSQGGLGLNLTEAQHVVLLEPLLDPALDVQAIGRVSRFGQMRDTHVHRYAPGQTGVQWHLNCPGICTSLSALHLDGAIKATQCRSA